MSDKKLPERVVMRTQRFFAVKVDGKYWMEIFDEGRSDVSQKGFTADPFLAYRLHRPERTLQQMREFPATDHLRPDFPSWFPELLRGEIVELKLIECIEEPL